MQTASKMCDHEGIRYRYQIEKHATGEYRAALEFFYPSGIGGKVTISNAEFCKELNSGLPFTFNPAGNGFIEQYAIGHIDSIIEKFRNGEAPNMAGFKPRTNPTPEQLKQMEAETQRLVDTFTVPGLAKIGGKNLNRNTVQEWKNRGRVSAQWSNDLCKKEVIKGAGFTRESLRPDVPFWYVD